MQKQAAINLLGGTAKKAAEAMGYKAVQTVYMWPPILTPDVADRVRGAAARLAPTSSSDSAVQSLEAGAV